jgi:DNA-binding XRE family transcriptional regulator
MKAVLSNGGESGRESGMASKKTPGKRTADQHDWPAVLKAWRGRKGITQKEAAEVLGVGMRTYQGWEQGEVNPIFKTPSAIADILNQDQSH